MAGRQTTKKQQQPNRHYAYRGLTKKKAPPRPRSFRQWTLAKIPALQLLNRALCMAAFRYCTVSGEMFSAAKEPLHNARRL